MNQSNMIGLSPTKMYLVTKDPKTGEVEVFDRDCAERHVVNKLTLLLKTPSLRKAGAFAMTCPTFRMGVKEFYGEKAQSIL